MPGPGGEQVGEAHVDIHINSAPGEAELAAFKAKVDRDFAELDRKRAEAKLSLKSAEFDAKIQKAKGELDNLEHRKARASVELDKAKFTAEIAEAKAEIKALGREKAVVNVDLKQLRAANRETALLAKQRGLDERAALQQAKAEQRLAVERDKSITRGIKERAELAKLGAQYEKLRGKQIALEKSSRGVFSTRSIATAEKEARTLRRVSDEADYVKHRIEKLGGSVADLDPEIQRNHTLWGRWLSRLGDTSIRIGPITTSVKGLGVGLGLLGPLIFELGGGLTALAGTVGEGLAGAFTVGAGALAGFSLAAAGIGFVIGPMVGEFKEVKSASEAVHKAMLKYGKGSDEVKTAQEKLNNELKGVSPIAREAFQSYGGLTSRWKALTEAARPAVFNAFGESLKTVQSLLPSFANESVKTTQIASKAWSGWMKSLRSSEAKGLLKGIMSDFRASIPGLADGIGSLVAMLGRLSAAGAHFLPGLSNGFAEWADNLERAVGGGQDLQSDVGGMVDQMRDLGHLTQDTGSLLVHIFDASADSGQGLVKSLDNVIKRWDKWTQSAAGKRGLDEFFGDSKTATEDFMSSLGHLTRLLFEFSRATAPVANGLLKIVTWIGDLVSAADDLVGVKTVFQGLGITLAGLWVAGKAMAFAQSLQTVTRALYGLAAGEAAVEAAQAGGGLGSLLFGRGGARKATTVAETGEDALRSSRQLALFGAAAGTAEAATIGLEGSAGLLAAALAPEVLIPAAAIAGLAGLALVLKQDRTTFEDLEAAARKAARQMSIGLDESSAATDHYVAAQHRNIAVNKEAAQARHRLIKLQKENASANKVTRAVEALEAVERRQTAAARRTGVVNKEQIDAQHKTIQGAKNRIQTEKQLIHGLEVRAKNEKEMQEDLAGGGELGNTEKKLADARKNLARATKELSAAEKTEAVNAIPYERSKKNLAPVTQQAERGLRRLINTIGEGATKKIGKFVDPKDVQRVTELGNKLTKLGRGGQVKQVAVKSQGADQTIAKLQRLQRQTNRVEAARATIKVGANDTQARSKLKRLSALSQRVAGTKQTIHILADSNSANQAIRRLRANLIKTINRPYKAELTAIDKATPVGSTTNNMLKRWAATKHQAKLTAVDEASSKAKTAKQNADAAGRTKPKINITANNAQALHAIDQTKSALAALNGYTARASVYVGVSGPGASKLGRYAGGPSVYMPPAFATGGINDREIQRADEKAVTQRSGPSFRVNRPTMLVGEQAPSHPEYVIATNPAYQTDNERYLEDAAGEFGYELVPAYKKGKGKGKGKKGGSGESAEEKRRKMLARKPKGKRSGSGKRAKSAVFPGEGKLYNERPINAKKAAIDRIEENYSRQLDHEEREIAAGRQEAWNFGWFRDNQISERNARRKLRDVLIPKAIGQIDAKENKAISYLTKGAGRPGNVKSLKRALNNAERAYDAIDRDDYADGNEGRKAYNKARASQKRAVAAAKRALDRVERERKRANKLKKLARTEKAKLRGEGAAQDNPMSEAEDDIQYINDVESGVVEAPYAAATEEKLIEESEEFKRAKADLVDAGLRGDVPGEEAARQHMIEITEREYGEAKGTPSPEDDIDIGERLKQLREEALTNGGKGTIGEQTASYNEAREQLYAQFASNIFGQLTPTAAPGVPAVGASGGTPTYAPGGKTALAAATPALNGMPSTSGLGAGKIEVVNNFAAPPPDPHTWTKQQEFELGALA
jgi:hypothetical protein